MLNIFPRNCNIGINAAMAKEKRHGIAWVESVEGGVTQQSFVADNPIHLINPSSGTIKQVFNQIIKLGMSPVHLELLINKRRVVYKYGQRKPIFDQTYS